MSDYNGDMTYVDKTLDKIQTNLSITDYERDRLRDMIRDLMKPTPESSMAAQTRVNDLENHRVWLINFVYMVTDKFNSLHDQYVREYDKEFTRISKLDRPNKQAVESEIHSSKPYLSNQRQVIENFDNFRTLLFSYLKSLEMARSSALTKWQSGRYGD